MERLRDLVGNLDYPSALDVDVDLYWDEDTYHFSNGCQCCIGSRERRGVRLLQAIEAGTTCESCWQRPEPGNPIGTVLHSIIGACQSEQRLKRTYHDPQEEFLVVTGVLDYTHEPLHSAALTWTRSIHRQAQARYDELLPVVTSVSFKEKALGLANLLSPEPSNGTSAGCYVIVDESYLHTLPQVAELAVPYHLAHQRWSHLLWAPQAVADALAALCHPDSEWDNKSFARQRGPWDLRESVVELWKVGDPLFGDLRKLLLAAEVIR